MRMCENCRKMIDYLEVSGQGWFTQMVKISENGELEEKDTVIDPEGVEQEIFYCPECGVEVAANFQDAGEFLKGE